jgi:hypothetical protein
MDITRLKLDLVQRLLASADASFLERMRDLFIRKEQAGTITEQEMEDMMAAVNAFGATAYGEDEPDISHLVLKEPNPDYKPWKPGM